MRRECTLANAVFVHQDLEVDHHGSTRRSGAARDRRGNHLCCAGATTASASCWDRPPDFSTLNTYKWSWDSCFTIDENYLDLACLVARNATAKDGHMGCVMVRDLEVGSGGAPQLDAAGELVELRAACEALQADPPLFAAASGPAAPSLLATINQMKMGSTIARYHARPRTRSVSCSASQRQL